jgi:hypothetical protein
VCVCVCVCVRVCVCVCAALPYLYYIIHDIYGVHISSYIFDIDMLAEKRMNVGTMPNEWHACPTACCRRKALRPGGLSPDKGDATAEVVAATAAAAAEVAKKDEELAAAKKKIKALKKRLRKVEAELRSERAVGGERCSQLSRACKLLSTHGVSLTPVSGRSDKDDQIKDHVQTQWENKKHIKKSEQQLEDMRASSANLSAELQAVRRESLEVSAAAGSPPAPTPPKGGAVTGDPNGGALETAAGGDAAELAALRREVRALHAAAAVAEQGQARNFGAVFLDRRFLDRRFARRG